jgi:LysR family hydrogen peroxide-inducible transcriptional activator
MSLIIKESFTANLTEQLKQGELDVVIISLPYNETGIVTQELYDESFSVLMPITHPLASSDSISTQQLEQENVLLLGEGHCFREQVKMICPGCVKIGNGEGSMQKKLEGGSLETIRYMVASGIGISILPDSAIGGDYLRWDLLTTRPLAQESPKRRIAMAWRKSFPRPQAVQLLGEAIRACNLNGATIVELSPDMALAVV